MDDAFPVWPLGHWVVGKALADGVGWVHGGRPFPLGDRVGGRRSWLSDLHLCTCVEGESWLRTATTDSDQLKPLHQQFYQWHGHPVFPHDTMRFTPGE